MENYYNVPRQVAFKITSIGGKRCTGVPRSNGNGNGNAAPSTTTGAATAPKVTKASTIQKPTNTAEGEKEDNAIVPTTTSSSSVPPKDANDSETASSTGVQTITSPTTIPTPEAISGNSSTNSRQEKLTPTSSPSGGTQGSKVGTDKLAPAKSTSRPIGATQTDNNNITETNTAGSIPSTISSPSSSRTNAAPIVGGIVGALVLLALIGIIVFCCRRRRQKRRNPDYFSSPPGTATREKFYEIDNGSVGPTKRSTRWKHEISSRAENVAWDLKATVAGFGTLLRATVSRDRAASPSLDMNRGNAPYNTDSLNSHNRNNSMLTGTSGRSSIRERLAEWRTRFGSTRQKQENETRGATMSQVGSLSESRAPTAMDRYRDSDQSGSTATKDLGLSLMNSQTSDLLKLENQPRDPFADPYTCADPFSDPKHESTSQSNDRPLNNPFSDPVVAAPPLVVSKPQTYVQQVRQSRGPSMSSSNRSSNRSSRSTDLISFVDRPTSHTSFSQFHSVAVPSHTHDRDTMYSSFSSERRGKGRSDPFDLERPDLWILPSQQRVSQLGMQSSPMGASRIKSMIDQNRAAHAHQRYNSSVRYSSGVNSLEDWGDPADYVDASVTSSVRGNASSAGGNEDYGINDLRTAANNKIYGHQNINGSLTEINVTLNENFGKKDLEMRNIDNVSPLSSVDVR